MTSREFHYQDGASAKFWRITRAGCQVNVQFGRIGSAGQTQTKVFPDEHAAEQAVIKQIAEKLKKGYQELGTATESTVASAPAPTRHASPAPSTTTAQPTAPPAPAPTIAATTEAQIVLEPHDWLWATWRSRQPLDPPARPAFDQAAALRRLTRVANDVYQWSWDWDRAAIPPVPTPAEAHFWLTAMRPTVDSRLKPKQLAEALAGMTFDGRLSSAAALALVDLTGHTARPILAALLRALCTPGEIVGHLLAEVADPHTAHRARAGACAVIEGLRQHVLPYLSATERAQLSQSVRPFLDPAQWPSDYYTIGPPAFYLAALLGGHDDLLRALVQGWADDRYAGEPWHDHYQRPQDIVLGLADPRLVELHMRRLRLRLNQPMYVRAWLAHTEFAALDVARDSILAETNKERAAELMQALACAIGPAAAPHMLELMHSSRAPQLARAWLDTHASHAIAGLLPLAEGRGKLAGPATEQLRRYARRGYGDAIAALITATPPESAARLRASILDAALEQRAELDERTTPAWLREAPDAQPRLPGWLQVADLPTVLLGDRRLNAEQLEATIGALQHSKLTAPHTLLVALKQHADAASLDAFAWALFEQWLAEGAPTREQWALLALGLLGGDTTALRLAPLVRAWPGESQHQRAVTGLECLRTIGSDTALMQISGIAQKVKFKALQARAGECMEQIARERGLSRAQLEDRVVPDCDLDARGRRVFDFGARTFHFALGPDMKPLIRDAQGNLKADLPKPGTRDDAAQAAQAVADWKLLKKQVAEVARVQALRLEQAMVTGRRWSRDEFELLLVRHPLMTHLTRTLIWGSYEHSGALAATFRVTEDQSYADSHDDPFELSAAASIGVAHPLQLAPAEQSRWGELLSDYTIVPPFPQLGRPIHQLEPDEAAQTEITRFNHQKITAAALVFGLDKLGWLRDAPADAGGFAGHFKPFPQANLTAVVHYQDGVAIGYIVDAPDQRLSYVAFVPGIRSPEWWPEHKQRLALGALDPVVVSEVLSDLTALMAKAK